MIDGSPNIYLNVVVRINADYDKLLQHLEAMDTRTAYLQIFEQSLSSALPRPLWETAAWKRQAELTPMPDDPYQVLPFSTFRAWMTVYELVMRDEGLIGTKAPQILGMEDLPAATAEPDAGGETLELEIEEVMPGEPERIHV